MLPTLQPSVPGNVRIPLESERNRFTVNQPHDWTYGDLHGCHHCHLRTRHWIILSLEAVVLGDEQIEDMEFVGVVGEGVLGLPQL